MASCFCSPVFQTGRFCSTGLKNRATESFFLAFLGSDGSLVGHDRRPLIRGEGLSVISQHNGNVVFHQEFAAAI